MSAFLGISVWISLATIVPGLMTIATMGGALVIIAPSILNRLIAENLHGLSEWSYAGLAITIMVMTQTFGILLERVLVGKEWLGPREKKVEIPPGIDPLGNTSFTLCPYYEYKGLYILLAELQDNEDSQGHLQRALAQFFLTNNSLISFAAGIATSLILLSVDGSNSSAAALYITLLCICLLVSFMVERIRFEVMAKALWAARRRRTGAIATGKSQS